jgi:uncharacterized protein (DUF983 family)
MPLVRINAKKITRCNPATITISYKSPNTVADNLWRLRMAICPHCFEQKKFWAPRCAHCNSETTLKQQFAIAALDITVKIAIPLTAIALFVWLFG